MFCVPLESWDGPLSACFLEKAGCGRPVVTLTRCKKKCNVRLSNRQIFRWHKTLAEGREDVNDENRAGLPLTSSSNDNVKRVRDLLNTDRRLSVRLISETLDITKTIVHEIVSESLGMRKVCAKLMPKVLTDDQKAR
ncbi:hypothetical protein NQ318_018126, partial [Aromia moschata]